MKKLIVSQFLTLVIFLSSCGVKGVPQPPLTMPVLGHGEPSYSNATQNVKVKKSRVKTNDWGDPPDFTEDKEK